MKRLPPLLLILLLLTGLAGAETLMTLSGSQDVLIQRGGVYRLTGSLTGAQLKVEAGKGEKVTLILDGLHIEADGPAIEIKKTGQASVVLASGTENSLISNGKARAALSCTTALDISGEGALRFVCPQGDGLYGKDSLMIRGGQLVIEAGNDGVKSRGPVSIQGGSLQVLDSQEGIEGSAVSISGGIILIKARDDGINAASSGDKVDPRQLAEPEVKNHSILISGGELTITSRGDGMDANGDLLISGGVIRISGPESGEDGALDADGKMAISGGSLMAFGAAAEAEMPQGVGQTSSLIVLENWVPARQEVQVKNAAGEAILSFTPVHGWDSVALSDPLILKGQPYTLEAGGEKLADFTAGTPWP